MLKLYCRQRGTYVEDIYTDKPMIFKTLNQIKKWLILYHSIDNDKKELNKMELKDLCECFDWQVELIEF